MELYNTDGQGGTSQTRIPATLMRGSVSKSQGSFYYPTLWST